VGRFPTAQLESGALGSGVACGPLALARAIAFCTAPFETSYRCARARCDAPARFSARTSASETGRRRSVPISASAADNQGSARAAERPGIEPAEDRLRRGAFSRIRGGAGRLRGRLLGISKLAEHPAESTPGDTR